MKVIKAPNRYQLEEEEVSVFLAGGISNCPDWQGGMVEALGEASLTLFNPRRDHFELSNPNEAAKQIAWEHRALRDASAISFWFPRQTLCPIVLYELGAWSMTEKPMYVGVDRSYERLQDVEVQTRLARPDVKIVYSLEDLCTQIAEHALHL